MRRQARAPACEVSSFTHALSKLLPAVPVCVEKTGLSYKIRHENHKHEDTRRNPRRLL